MAQGQDGMLANFPGSDNACQIILQTKDTEPG